MSDSLGRVSGGRSAGALFGVGILIVSWALLAGVLGLAATEIHFRVKERAKEAKRAQSRPRWAARQAAYLPYKNLDLNPFYLCFYGFDRDRRRKENSAVCSIDACGFRGPGPEAAGPRQLAFILGGSSAFGYLCSSDETTISAFLNRAQDKYFFVNAAVPYWNTTQELVRLAVQLLDYKPALILTYDGSNDLQVALDYAERPDPWNYPAGTPGGFCELYQVAGKWREPATWHSRLKGVLPMTWDWLEERSSKGKERPGDTSGDIERAAAARYLLNLGRINRLAVAHGARHVGIFQPVRDLHEHLPSHIRPNRQSPVKVFREAVFAQKGDLPLHDFSVVFDRHFAEVPCYSKSEKRDLSDEDVFVDFVHLGDRGNEMVATDILPLLP